jgi:hypothetical protein
MSQYSQEDTKQRNSTFWSSLPRERTVGVKRPYDSDGDESDMGVFETHIRQFMDINITLDSKKRAIASIQKYLSHELSFSDFIVEVSIHTQL